MIHVGCVDFPGAKAKLFRTFDFNEVAQTFFQLPRPATLAKLRAAAPKGFTFAMRAWQLVSHDPSSPGYARVTPKPPKGALPKLGLLRDTAEVKDAWKKTLAAAAALDARFIVVETPSSLNPSGTSRDTLKRFFANAPREGRTLVWEPRGLWQPEQARAFAKEMGVLVAEDPLNDAVEGTIAFEGDVAYVRIRSLGGRVSPSKLEFALETLADVKEAFVVVETQDAMKDATRLLALAEEMGVGGKAAQGAAFDSAEADKDEEDDEDDEDEDDEDDEDEDGEDDEDDEDEEEDEAEDKKAE